MILAGDIVGMVTCYIKKMIATCVPMIGNLYDTIIVASHVKQWRYSSLQSIAVRKELETVASLLRFLHTSSLRQITTHGHLQYGRPAQ